jgi:hypothetical protein
MKIIYSTTNEEGQVVLAQLTPTPRFLDTLEGTLEEKLIHIANKDLPTNTPYEIVANNAIPSDRTFRDAWEYVAGSNEKISADLSADDLAKYNMTENK